MKHPLFKRAAVIAALSASLAMPAVAGIAAPSAFGKPINENTIKTECKAAGGTYQTAVAVDLRSSACTYRASDGTTYTDHYNNGNYVGTTGPGGRPA
ncbi:hypothetical protein H7J93_11555 [Mycobacterium barrassiae]|uniref:hypothetical protein n=1 Tax=Mycobacterium barrassiae TaxID=319709 RepID=UPI002265F94F|nr:hypothetical protein [Mycobacterium barrassiae]MCV7300264.1 hypothetical protein [Mycobacterium barrassiae]